jgi:hypothetical protein
MLAYRLGFGEHRIPPSHVGCCRLRVGWHPRRLHRESTPVSCVVKKRRISGLEIMLCVFVVVLAGGCSLGSHTNSTTGPTLTGFLHYRGHGVTFAYPATWRYHRPGFPTPATTPLIDLSAQPMVNPCRTTGNATLCDLPLNRLRPGGVVVTWTTGGPPAHPRHPGVTVKVARPGYCARIGGDETINARIVTRQHQVFTVDACLRAPGVAANEHAIRTMLASARATSP